MTTPKHIARLASKRLLGTISPDEEQELQLWADTDPSYRQWLDNLTSQSLFKTVEEYKKYQPVENVWDNPRVWTQIKAIERKHVPFYKQAIFRWAAVAMLIATLAVSLWFFLITPTVSKQDQIVQEILPGGNKATLTLSDGRTIKLDEEQAGIVIGDQVTYEDGGLIVEGQDNKMLVLTTPMGGTYQITLSDGSRVWLNANSTLRYPTSFSQKERVVEVIGEAYFVVSKDINRPFKVRSYGQELRVLGTEFNIKSYDDESTVSTTLVEGSVQIHNLESSSLHLLSPGEQSVVQKGRTEIHSVNVDMYVSWKNGGFYFDRTPFKDVMLQLARWYNVEVVYLGKIPQETFSGEMERDLTLQEALKLLNMSAVQIQITDGPKLVVN